MNNRVNKTLNIVLAVVLAVFILTFSVAMPILLRSFYYVQIEPLGILDMGYTKEECKKAYDEMLDFCIGKSDEFGTGTLKWSDEGESHFADCRKLFILDFWLLGMAFILIVLFVILSRCGKFRIERLGKKGPFFWAGSGLLAAIAIIGGLVALDLDRAFEIFHKLFFPGKDNWLFDPLEDEIINILPEEYFRNCAIAIAALVLILCVVCIFIKTNTSETDNVDNND